VIDRSNLPAVARVPKTVSGHPGRDASTGAAMAGRLMPTRRGRSIMKRIIEIAVALAFVASTAYAADERSPPPSKTG
jgi:hypothetical protein